MRNLAFTKRTRVLTIGKLTGLSMFAALALFIIPPLISLANPAMCGRTPLPGTWKFIEATSGFSTNATGNITTWQTSSKQIQLGSWVEVSGPGPNGKIIQVPVVVVKATYNKKKKNYDLISFNYGLLSNDAWQVNFSVDTVKGCSPTTSPCTIPRLTKTDPSVALVKPIADMQLDPAPAKTPIMLGTWAEVSLTDAHGKVTQQPAAIISAVKQHIDPTKGYFARGYLPPSDSIPNGELVQITITPDVMKQITASIVKAGGKPGTW